MRSVREIALRFRRQAANLALRALSWIWVRHRRDCFRVSAAHNTVRVDGRDQGKRSGPFRQKDKPRVS